MVFSPQGMVEQGLTQVEAWQASWPGQWESSVHSEVRGVSPMQPLEEENSQNLDKIKVTFENTK